MENGIICLNFTMIPAFEYYSKIQMSQMQSTNSKVFSWKIVFTVI